MARVDYGGWMADAYDRGRGLHPAAVEAWRAAVVPRLRAAPGPGRVLDLGAGTGRFSGLLVGWSGGPVVAVEPAAAMAHHARGRDAPGVAVAVGAAEAIPLGEGTVRAAWLSQVVHHVEDLGRAALELARVVAGGGLVLLRGALGSDGGPRTGTPDYVIERYFPASRRVADTFPSPRRVLAAFGAAGFTPELVTKVHQVTAADLRELHRRAATRADSTLVALDDATFTAGLNDLQRAAEAEARDEAAGTPPAPVVDRVDLLVLRAPRGAGATRRRAGERGSLTRGPPCGRAGTVTQHARAPRAEESRFRGEPAVELAAGEVAATFVPGVGMTGVSLRHRGRERLALREGLDTLRGGHTAGLPLLAPWANRLSQRRYAAAGVAVAVDGDHVRVDPATGLPIHGLLVGRAGWDVDALVTGEGHAELRASRVVDEPSFPFPHRLAVTARVGDDRLRVDTTVTPTGDRAVPVAFGWHPYLALPEAPRSSWHLRAPDRTHLLLDGAGIPTGTREDAPAEHDPIGDRTYDDLYELGQDRTLAFELDDGSGVEVGALHGYPFAQVWVPAGKPFASLEPMAAPTDALIAGTAPLVVPGDSYTATFALTLT